MHSWWKTQDFGKIESGPNYITAAHAFVKATLRLGLPAPFVARNNRLGQMAFNSVCQSGRSPGQSPPFESR